jgi:putative phage-type endonuclease
MSLDGTCITPADRDAWLAERQRSIGGSEAAAAIGVSPYESALGLYLRKIGAASPVRETEAMRWGTRLEPAIAEAYQEATGHSFIAAQQFLRSPDHEWMTATIDRVRDDRRLIEFKTAGIRSAHLWGEPGTDEIPIQYMVQVHHQLVVAGAEVADVATLIGGQELRIYTIDRDDDVAARIVEREAEFWSRVERRDPPPVDPGRDGDLMATLFPRAVGEVDLGPVGCTLFAEYEYYSREIKVAQEGREKAKVELLALMKDAASARLGDGRIITRKIINVEGRTIVRHPYSYVDLRLRKGD